MGSNADHSLPPSDDASLILTHPTPEERRQTASLTHVLWGPALSQEDYVEREAYLTTVPLAKDGGITHWILTDPSLPPNERPILSSCESTRKRCLVCGPDGQVRDAITHGIGSVFTDERYRGKGYAGRIMEEIGKALETWQADWTACNGGACSSGSRSRSSSGSHGSNGHDIHANGNGALSGDEARSPFSVLYSDIGKKFYAQRGWAPFASTHLSFDPIAPDEIGEKLIATNGGQNGDGPSKMRAQPIGYHQLAELCATDERLLRARMAARASSHNRTCVALLPDLDAFLWHLMREDFMTSRIFGRTPTVRGAVYGVVGQRVWAVWTRGYYGGLHKMEGNALHVLRLVVEDEEGCSRKYLADAVRQILAIARAEAAEWRSADVQLWNPDAALMKACEDSGHKFAIVERDKDSIASLMWYGEEKTTDIDWMLNEKYAWC